MKSSLIFSTHNFDKLLLQLITEEPQDVSNLIKKLDNEFKVHWWQKRSKERKIKYLEKRIERILKKGQILLNEEIRYEITSKGKRNLGEIEQRDQKVSNIVKNIIKPPLAFGVSFISILTLFLLNTYGFMISENPIFILEGIFLLIVSGNFIQLVIAPRNPFRTMTFKTFRFITIIIGIIVLFLGLSLLTNGIVTLNQEITRIILIINFIIALFSFLIIYTSGYLNENLNVKVIALNHRNAIFSPLFVVVSIISMDFNLFYITGVIVIVYGFNMFVETRRSNLGHFTHHILILLNNGPQSYEEIFNLDNKIAMLFGAPSFFQETPDTQHLWINFHGIQLLLAEGLIEKRDDLYYITAKAIPEADRRARGMIRGFTIIKSLVKPRVSPLLSLIVHLILGSLKLVGFVLTGSVGLLGDGIDSAIDGVSSIIVTIAMKIKRETEATYLLIILMVVSGIGILLSSATRIIDPRPINEGNFGIIIAIFSIIVCFLLYLYQKYSGFINRNLTIIAQSEDSKNHVLNASLVLLAIGASYLEIYFIDGFVGCFIGVLILRGAYEIYTDLRSYNQGELIDFGKYKLGLWKSFNRFQYRMLEKWVLFQVYQEFNSYNMITNRFMLDFKPIVIKESQGEPYVLNYTYNNEDIQQALVELEHKNFINHESGKYSITDLGIEQINKYKVRYHH
jgi:hypothetical protein